MHHQTDEQPSRSAKWLKFSGNVEYAWQLVKNASGRRAAEVFMETRKSTKSWDQLSVQKFPKVTQSRKKVHRVGKLVLPSLVAWRACTKIRDAPAEKRHESKVQRSSTRTEMLFLWCFSAPYWERISAASGAHCTLLSHIMLLNVWNWSLLRSEGKVQNWVRRRSCFLNLCEAHGLNTWGQLPHLMKNGRNFSIMRRTSCSSLSRVLSIGSSCSTSPTSPTSLSQDYEKYYVSSNNTKWEYEWKQAQGDLLQTQSQDDEQARGNPLPPELPRGKAHQEKNKHSLPETQKLRNAGGPELLGLCARDAQVKPHLEQQNFGELVTAEHKV